MSPTPPEPPSPRSRWVAIVTGALSILVAVLYLAFVTLLDSRGPLQPPPPEALAGALMAPLRGLGEVAAGGQPVFSVVPPPA
ncbi:MAG: hypothetical protein ACK522_03245 [Synechococcaceae cyanobacterium]|jgi:hypothetical protein